MIHHIQRHSVTFHQGFSGENSVSRKCQRSETQFINLYFFSTDDNDEDEEDESKMQEEMKDFIVEEAENEGEDKESVNSEDEVEELSEDDLEIIRENLGLKAGGRVQVGTLFPSLDLITFS